MKVTWEYEKSFHYWNSRLHGAGQEFYKIPGGLEGWDLGVKARAEVNRRMANDSRLHPNIRRFAHKSAKQAFDHINGTCRQKKNRYTGFVYPCDLCDHRDNYQRLLNEIAAGKYARTTSDSPETPTNEPSGVRNHEGDL